MTDYDLDVIVAIVEFTLIVIIALVALWLTAQIIRSQRARKERSDDLYEPWE